MRNIFTLFVFVLFTSMAFAQTQRTTLLEQFTQASCGPCTASNPWIDNYYETTALPVLRIYYHTSWPGTDPMYNHNTAVNGARTSYYGINSVPNSVIDGTEYTPPGFSGAWTNITMVSRTGIPSPFSLSVTHTMASDYSVSVDVSVTAAQAVNTNNMKLHAVIVEKEMVYCDAPGSNGEADFPYVVKDMLPSASGTDLNSTWANGENQTFSFDYSPANFRKASELAVVVFIQNNTTREILQSALSETFTAPNANDAAVINVFGAQECAGTLSCQDATFRGTVEVLNMGSSPLTSLDLNWSMSGVGSGTTSWTGDIGPFETGIIDLDPISTPSNFPFSFLSVSAANPNGMTDGYTGNNTQNKQVSLGSGTSTNQLTLQITTDQYPGETTWRVRKTGTGEEVASGGPYGSQNTTISPITIDLEDGTCYSFEFFDAFGDGICCGYGSGSFTLTDSDGTVLANGTNFGSEVVEAFRTEGEATNIENVVMASSFNVQPNPVYDVAQVEFSLIQSSNIRLQVYDLLGELIISEELGEMHEGAYTRAIDLSGVANGMYMVSLMADNDVITEKIVVSK
ncbi:MAG: T9SS type A sorting domain-containing protein [Bacteroidota bacterium]